MKYGMGMFAGIMLALVGLNGAQAEPTTMVTRITKVAPNTGKPGFEKTVVTTKNSRLYKVALTGEDRIAGIDLTARLIDFEKREVKVRITFDGEQLLEATETKEKMSPDPGAVSVEGDYDWFKPTVLATEAEAQVFMDRLAKIDTRSSSECYWRAHYWSHTLWRESDVQSKKDFIFFSKNYRKLNKKHIWGFHVAPVLQVRDVDYVLDPEFNPRFTNDAGKKSRRILTIEDWAHQFVDTGRTCKTVNSYEEFLRLDATREDEHCYLMTTPMYYWNVVNLDGGSAHRTYDTWDSWQLDASCKAVSFFGSCGRWKDQDSSRYKAFVKEYLH